MHTLQFKGSFFVGFFEEGGRRFRVSRNVFSVVMQ